MNGDFSQPFAGSWNTDGGLAIVSQHAQMTDTSQSGDNTLQQGVALAHGSYTISFDVISQLSDRVLDGYFHDAFFASLYFANSVGSGFTFSADAISLLDLDSASADAHGGAYAPGAADADFPSLTSYHYSLSFLNNFNYVLPTFDLFDLNGTAGDSIVYIDNVVISANEQPVVPEPATLGLLAVGLSSVAALRRRKVFAR